MNYSSASSSSGFGEQNGWSHAMKTFECGDQLPRLIGAVFDKSLVNDGRATTRLTVVVADRGGGGIEDFANVAEDASTVPRETKKSQRRWWHLKAPSGGPTQNFLLFRGINYGEIKSWLSVCETHHEGCQGMQAQLRQTYPGLMVIDCLTRRLVPAGAHCQYVALSYVWGAATNYGLPRPDNDAFITDLGERQIPQTIQDCMTVVCQIGMRYLWVDRYCIDESNKTMKHRVIANMDSIYQGARLTIIAAAGTNAEHGLPGVSKTYRSLRFRGTFGTGRSSLPFIIFHNREQPREEILGSVWSTRGWTYQEALLSQRCLLFTETQMCFQCPSAAYEEDMRNVTQQPSLLAVRPFRTIMTGADIFGVIDEYAVRDLSFPSDSLRAFLGILRMFEKRHTDPSWHLWGLPLPCRSTSSEYIYGHFATSLLWKSHSQPLTRVAGLPSWSWAGWRRWAHIGPYHLPVRFPLDSVPPDTVIEIEYQGIKLSIVDYCIAMRRRSTLAELETHEVEPGLVLYLTGWTIWILEAELETLMLFRDIDLVQNMRSSSHMSLVVFILSCGNPWLPGKCLLLAPKGPESPDIYYRYGILEWPELYTLTLEVGNPDYVPTLETAPIMQRFSRMALTVE